MLRWPVLWRARPRLALRGPASGRGSRRRRPPCHWRRSRGRAGAAPTSAWCWTALASLSPATSSRAPLGASSSTPTCARARLYPPCCPAQGEAARPASLVEAGRGAGLCRRTQADIRERSLDSSAVLRCAEPSRCSRAGPRRYLFHATPNGNAARPGPVPTVTFNENGSFMSTLEGAPSRRTRLQWELLMKDYDECVRSRRPTRPPPRTKWTRRVPHPVLTGHAASLTPYPQDMNAPPARRVAPCPAPAARHALSLDLRAQLESSPGDAARGRPRSARVPAGAPPPPSCTNWTRLVLLPVLTGHVSAPSFPLPPPPPSCTNWTRRVPAGAAVAQRPLGAGHAVPGRGRAPLRKARRPCAPVNETALTLTARRRRERASGGAGGSCSDTSRGTHVQARPAAPRPSGGRACCAPPPPPSY